jgi:hypothetical protein
MRADTDPVSSLCREAAPDLRAKAAEEEVSKPKWANHLLVTNLSENT